MAGRATRSRTGIGLSLRRPFWLRALCALGHRAPRFLCVVCLLALFLPTSTPAATDWVSRLQPPAAGTYWLSDEPPVLLLPPDLPADGLDRLTLLVDQRPAAVAWERQDAALVLRLQAPLTEGNHDLRLVEGLEDGSTADRGRWRIEVRASQAVESESPGVWSRVTRLLGGGGEEPEAEAANGDGNAVVKEDRWEAEVRTNREYLDRRDRTAGVEPGEEYRMQLRFRDERLLSEGQVGSHAAGSESLVVDGSAQPGASLSVETPDSRARVTGFARTQEARLTDDPAYAPEGPDRRIQGSQFAVKPVAPLKENLEVTGTYYQGQLLEGSGTAATEAGDGWSLATDTRWIARRLRLRGELARTRHDEDGAIGAREPVEGEAYAGLASIAILEDREVAGAPLDWDLSLEAERTGRGFASLANPGADENQQTTALSNRFAWDDYSLEARGSERIDNIEALAALPQERTRELELGGEYAPSVEPGDGTFPLWLGRPTIGLSFGVEDRRRASAADEAGSVTRSREYDTTLQLGSDYRFWGWDLSQSLGSAADEAIGDSVSSETGLGARVDVGERLVLAPNGRWSKVESLSTREAERSWELGVQADLILLPETLTSSLNYAYGTTWDPVSREASQALGGELVWRFQQADEDRPALDLSLAGSVEDRWDLGLSDDRTRDYQVFLNLRFTLPEDRGR